MKKNFLFKVVLESIIGLIFVLLMLFSQKFFKITFIENIKKAMNDEASANTLREVTVVDVTNLVTGDNIAHEHVYKKQYDENQHWEECIICNEKNNQLAHSFKTTWASGKESCEKNNSYTKTCNCGYSETGHKPCVWDGKTYATAKVGNGYAHIRRCSVCNESLYYSYYLKSYGSGVLYSAIYDQNPYIDDRPLLGINIDTRCFQYCYSSSGVKLDCDHAGTCAICGTVWKANQHELRYNKNDGIVYCEVCERKYGTVTETITQTSNAPCTYTIVDNFNLTNGATFNSKGAMRAISNPWQSNTQTVSNLNTAKTSFTITTVTTFKPTWKSLYQTYPMVSVNIQGSVLSMISEWFIAYPDPIAPEITSIATDSAGSLTEWSKTKPIVISGTENYCDVVTVKIVDDEGNIVYEGGGNVSNNSYSITCIPEVQTTADGRKFKVIVTDSCNNYTEKEFIIAKVDAKPPEIISPDSVQEDWAKEKSIILRSNDNGIGEVEIAFNDKSDYRLAKQDGEIFSREYKIVGDVYLPKKAMIIYKDGLENVSVKELIIDKIDNTAPTILGGSIHNNILTINANDVKEGMGEGSGVCKYRYITSKEKIYNPVVLDDAIQVNYDKQIIVDDIVNIKYVYVVAEDLVRKCE
ncbi:MAG: hypothetical protein HFJ25_04300 [Clostridia bacterium]|jgi:hypothetical protein|nr:hypothetical protein [Clostridia bacterium]